MQGQGIQSLAPMGGPQQKPMGGPQQKPMGGMPQAPMGGSMGGLGSVEDRVAAFRGRPEQLQQKYAMSQDLLDLLALQKIKSEKEAAARQMQLAMNQQAMQNGQMPTVAQQREQEVHQLTKNELAQQRAATDQQKQQEEQEAIRQLASSGIATAPGANTVGMAQGGIIGFDGTDQDNGSEVPEVPEADDSFLANVSDELTPQERAKLRMMKSVNGPNPFDASGPRQENEWEKRVRTDKEAYERRIGGGRGEVNPDFVRPATVERLPDNQQATRSMAAGATQPPQMPTINIPAINVGRPPAAGITSLNTLRQLEKSDLGKGILAGLKQPTAGPTTNWEESATKARNTAAEFLKPTAEQEDVYRKNIAEQERMYAENFDPDKMKWSSIAAMLRGAGGRRWNVLGAAGDAMAEHDKGVMEAQSKARSDLQAARQGLVSLQRDHLKDAVHAGAQAGQTAGHIQGSEVTAQAHIDAAKLQTLSHLFNTVVNADSQAAQNAVSLHNAQLQAQTQNVYHQALIAQQQFEAGLRHGDRIDQINATRANTGAHLLAQVNAEAERDLSNLNKAFAADPTVAKFAVSGGKLSAAETAEYNRALAARADAEARIQANAKQSRDIAHRLISGEVKLDPQKQSGDGFGNMTPVSGTQ